MSGDPHIAGASDGMVSELVEETVLDVRHDPLAFALDLIRTAALVAIAIALVVIA